MKVACVEKSRTLGGTCLNVGCIPSKALLDSSELYSPRQGAVQEARNRGRRRSALDLKAMLARKDEVVKGLTDGVRYLFRKNKVEPIFGTARLLSASSLEVALNEGGRTEVSAGHILLATGIGSGEPAVSCRSTARQWSIRPGRSRSRRCPTTWS